jgi:hypothetical protein
MLIIRIFRTSHGQWMIRGPWLYHREQGLHAHITQQAAQNELVLSDHVDTNALDTVMRTVTVVSYAQWRSSHQEQAYYVRKLLRLRSGQVCRINFDAYLLRLADMPGCQPCQGVPLPSWSAAQFYGMLVRKRLRSSLRINCGPYITCRVRMRLAEFSQMCASSPLNFHWDAQRGRLAAQVRVLQHLDFLLGSSEAQRRSGWPYRVHATGTIVQVCTEWQPIQLRFHMATQMLRITFPTQVVSDVGVAQVAQ